MRTNRVEMNLPELTSQTHMQDEGMIQSTAELDVWIPWSYQAYHPKMDHGENSLDWLTWKGRESAFETTLQGLDQRYL
jgi:hypothetical protein